MLSQIVRLMVNTQICLLAKSKTTRSTLIKTIAKWLSFLGLEAKVTQLYAAGDKIQLSMTVERPDTSENGDWQEILLNLNRNQLKTVESAIGTTSIPSHQKAKYQRILAYAIQKSYPNSFTDWQKICPQLQLLGLEKLMLLEIKSALEVPQDIDLLVEDLEADIAALAFSQIASIALLDRLNNP